jgi:hypothetical protein
MKAAELDDFRQRVADTEKKNGAVMLADEDLLLLACREIAKTYTRDEKDYK